jgi:FMN-dependent NADH-azoreductase
MKLLHIDSSISGEASASRQLSSAIAKALTRSIAGLEVVRRDLAADPLPHLDGSLLAAAAGSDPADAATRAEAMRGVAVLEEFLDADIVVIGAPMYNFAIPSQLKSWIDRIIIAGKTFRYSETGPVGLAGGKKVIVASARGGVYPAGSAQQANDFQEKYLRTILDFIGIDNIEFVRAEGLAFGPEQRQAALDGALASISAMTTALPAKAA